MTRRDILHRMAGVVALLGAGASTVLHREVWLAHASGPATGLEAALGLATFVLASLGLLLVLGGSRFRDGWKRNGERAARRREQRNGERTARRREQRVRSRQGAVEDAEAENRRIMADAAIDPAALASGRAALATFLVLRARQTAVQSRFVSQTTTQKYEPGAQQ